MLDNSGNFESYISGIKKIRKSIMDEDDDEPMNKEEYQKKLIEKQEERSKSIDRNRRDLDIQTSRINHL